MFAKEKLKQSETALTKSEKELEAEARKMIEDFIVPLLNKSISKNPLFSAFIHFVKYSEPLFSLSWFYTTSLSAPWNCKKSPYSCEVVSKAVELAHEFNIEAYEEYDGSDCTVFSFCSIPE